MNLVETWHYSGVNLHHIDSPCDLYLDSMCITDTINSNGCISATKVVSKNVSAMGTVSLIESNISGSIASASKIVAVRCSRLGDISAEKSVILNDCPLVGSIHTSRSARLTRAHIQGDVLCQYCCD